MSFMVAAFTAHCILPTAYSQPGGYSTQDKKAIKLYESGSTCMQQRKLECAKSDFLKAANADERFVEPRIMLAEIARLSETDFPVGGRGATVVTVDEQGRLSR